MYNSSSLFLVYQLDVPGKPPKRGAFEASLYDVWTDSSQSNVVAALLQAPWRCLSLLPHLCDFFSGFFKQEV